MIRKLIKEYGSLSEKEQEKVESIHEYLVNINGLTPLSSPFFFREISSSSRFFRFTLFQEKQLDLLLDYIETKEEAEKKERPLNGENGMVNISESNFTMSDGLLHINLPNILKLNSADLFPNQDLLRDSKLERNF